MMLRLHSSVHNDVPSSGSLAGRRYILPLLILLTASFDAAALRCDASAKPLSLISKENIFLKLPGIVADSSAYPRTLLAFGMGFSTTTLFSSEVEQIFFPGFKVAATWSNPDLVVEFRGRFFFGEVDGYHIEASGFRNLTPENPRLYAGGGIGYGGMNQKELIIFDLNGQPVPGIFFHNGKGLHAFLGFGMWLYRGIGYQVKADLDYYVSLYNIDKIHTPTGLRLSLSVLLHAPE